MAATWSKTSVLAALLPASQAFQLTFYAGNACRGARLGGPEISLNSGCFDAAEFAGTATSCLITRGPDDGDNDVVTFYDSDTCALQTATATGNTGCVNVGAFNPWNSANVISGDGSPVKRSVEEVKRDFGGLKHGDFVESGGELFRYQQIGEGAFTGVRPEEWDLIDRTADSTPLGCTNDWPFNFTDYYNSPHTPAIAKSYTAEEALAVLEGRQFEGACRTVRNCVLGIGILAEYYFPAATEYLVNGVEAARQRSAIENIWRFLQNPFVLTYGGGIGTGVVVARYLGPTPSSCAPSDTATLAEAIDYGVVGQANAIQNSVVTPAGEGTLNAAVVPPDQRNTGQFCGAPATDPGPSAIRRMKRSLLAEVPHYNEWLMERSALLA